LWVAEQGTDSAEAFTLAPGSSTATQVSVHVSLPGSVLPVGGPAGLVANTGTGFDLSDGKPAGFIFDTLDGHIEAWNQDDGLTGNAEDEVTIPGGRLHRARHRRHEARRRAVPADAAESAAS